VTGKLLQRAECDASTPVELQMQESIQVAEGAIHERLAVRDALAQA
jgi:hypothetical protein